MIRQLPDAVRLQYLQDRILGDLSPTPMSDALADADFVDVVVEQAGMPGGQALISARKPE